MWLRKQRLCAFLILNVIFCECQEVGEPRTWPCNEIAYKLVERLALLEREHLTLQQTVEVQAADVNVIQHQLIEQQRNQWGAWSTWSTCSFKCTGSDAERGRSQSRTRQVMSDNKVTNTETEQRPCNAVEYAGCQPRSRQDGDEFGVAYDYRDLMAQSTCTALMEAGGHVYAVRRECSNKTVSCQDLCAGLSLTCFNALHVYHPEATLPWGVNGAKSAKTYRYNSCDGNYCGPNFCCCRGS